MKTRWIAGATPIAAGLAALFALSPAAAMTPVTATAETQHYRLELDIGDSETMYSKAEADKQKPASGEIMVGGAMADMHMGHAPQHLEVHIVSKATGRAVRDAKVAIAVTGAETMAVPVATMYGIKEGPEDWHYGNNVMLAPGDYSVVVTANGERATFKVTVPAR